MLTKMGVRLFTHRAALLASSRALSSLPEYTLLPLPALSPTMESGNLASWNKAEGDLIEPGDVIAEVETDKAVVDYEAQELVYLAKILVGEGTKDIAVGAALGVICEEEEDVAALMAADASLFLADEPAAAAAAAPTPAPAAAAAAAPPPPPPPPVAAAPAVAAATPPPAARKAKKPAGVAVPTIPIANILAAEWAKYTDEFGSTLMDSLVETPEE